MDWGFLGGLVKSPFLALAIGLIACGQGLATQGGAAAVGARTTTAVDGAGSVARRPGARGGHAEHPQGDRDQDSRQPGPERSVLHQRRAHRSGERDPDVDAQSRAFFASTSTQIQQLTTDLDRLFGPEGTLVKFVDDAHAAINKSDLPATTRSARDALERTSLAADDLRRTLPTIRDSLEQLRQLARLLEEQPESVVYGPRPSQVPPR